MSYSVRADLLVNLHTGFQRSAQAHPWSATCHFAIERIKRKVPLPIRMSAKVLNPLSSDLGGEHRAEPVPPKPHRFMADVDAAFVQRILHISKRKRKPDVYNHRQADHLRAGFEVAKWAAFCHPPKLRGCPGHLNQFCSDSAR